MVQLDHELPETQTLVLAAPALPVCEAAQTCRGRWQVREVSPVGGRTKKNQEKENSRSRPSMNKNGLKNSWVFCLFQ